MRLLLDTHVLLWTFGGTRPLGAHARETIDGAEEIFVSVVSFAEIGVKAAIGKLSIPPSLVDRTIATGIRILGLETRHGLAVARLPPHHRDPFDRLLIAQAAIEDLAFVSADAHAPRYPIRHIDATR